MTLNKVENWHGVWTALITPLLPTSSAKQSPVIDLASLEKLINDQISQGVRGLVIAGSTGEGSLLSWDSYSTLLKSASDITKGRIPLVAGLGILGTDHACKSAELAGSLGYQGVLSSPPAYIKAPQDSLGIHFLEVASVGLPVCLYEISGRAGVSIGLDLLVELLLKNKSPFAKNFLAIKDASGDISRQVRTRALLGDRLCYLSGDDGTYAAFCAAGGNGVISVVSHLLPKTLQNILSLTRAGKISEACSEQQRIMNLIDALFLESNPIPVKSLMHSMGFLSHLEFCKPLRPMSAQKLEYLLTLARNTHDDGTSP